MNILVYDGHSIIASMVDILHIQILCQEKDLIIPEIWDVKVMFYDDILVTRQIPMYYSR